MLKQRLERAAKDKFPGDLHAAARYLRSQADFYYKKLSHTKGTPHHDKWREVWRSYLDAQLATEYWLSVEEEWEQDQWDDYAHEERHAAEYR